LSDKQSGITLSRKQILIGAIAILILFAVGITLAVNWSKWFGGEKDQSSSGSESSVSVELDPNAGEYTGKKPADKGGAQEGIKIPGYPTITVAKDKEDVVMALLNPEGNPCYFKFTIALKENNETIYESKYVAPGKCIYDVHLNKALTEGEHPAVIKISTISLDGKTPLNGANVETVLIAK